MKQLGPFLFAVRLAMTGAQLPLQAKERVLEQVVNFMARPVVALSMWKDFYNFGGFPNDLRAPDRDLALKYIYAMALAGVDFTPFYGLEDGLLAGYFLTETTGLRQLFYREPGDNGFDLNDFDMGIYRNVCVEAETGKADVCVMPEDTEYVSCVNDCELVRCNNPELEQQDCSLLSGQEKTDCESEIIWCRNYSKLVAGGILELGYVPTSDYCINSQGKISETPGEILTPSESGEVTMGDCTFRNGTPVERRIWGPYAFCGGGICDETYKGARSDSTFDPRLRPWYMSSRKQQRPWWSDPYIFLGGIGNIGITYTNPIYSSNPDGTTVFHGVLGADLVLDDFTNFLVDAFNGTNSSVAIYEVAEPHYLIGISTGTEVVRSVLSSDQSQPCPVEQLGTDQCTFIQITIGDLEGNTDDDILQKAHFALEAENFREDIDPPINVQETEEVHSRAHQVSFVAFEDPEANLEWRILVTVPVNRDSEDTITTDEPLFVVICILAGLGFAICMTMVLLFFWNRNERAVILGDFKFTSAFIFSCALLNLGSLTLLGETEDWLCMVRMWGYYMLTAMALSPLLVKAWRTYCLLGTSTASGGKKTMTNFQAWLRTLPVMALQAAILTTFTIVDPPLATQSITEERPPTQSITCEHNSDAFVYIQGVLYAILLGAGCLLAWLTRNIDPRFADARALMFAMYNIAFTAVMFTAIFAVVTISESGLAMMTALGIFWITSFSSVVFVVPKLVAVHEERRITQETRSQLRAVHNQRQTKRFSSINYTDVMHESDGALKVLVCSANMGNAEPTLSSMKAWIPDGGDTDEVKTLDGVQIEERRFDVIAIGMQESTWTKKKRAESTDDLEELEDDDENAYMAAVEGEDTVALRKMLNQLLGDNYELLVEESRGQMRMYIWVLEDLFPYIDNVKVSGANTGIGNVMANKGGIVVSLEYKKTRFSFLSAHLAAHEGDNYYKARCENVYDILRASKTFKLSQKFDLALSSHHMFVFGDLNFRTKFEEKAEHEENVRRALDLIEQKDFKTLYSFDELHKGVQKGDLLVGFETLPCMFYPTFKVQRQPGIEYKEQRTPSYTDRILYKSSSALKSFVRPLAYEPCIDFVTSDHKPVRGAFSIATNEMVSSLTLDSRFRMVFSEMECFDLPAGDVDGYSDPFLMFVWDSIDLVEEKKRGFRFGFPRLFSDTSWPQTNYISKTLNPKWKGKEIVLCSTGKEVSRSAMLYVGAFDYDFGASDDVLGTLPLCIGELVTMNPGQSHKVCMFDRPLQANGKPAGHIKFKLEVSMIIG